MGQHLKNRTPALLDAINTVNSSNGSSGSTSSPECDSNVLFLYYCMFAVLFHALLIVQLNCTFQEVNQRCLQRMPWQSPLTNLMKHWCSIQVLLHRADRQFHVCQTPKHQKCQNSSANHESQFQLQNNC